MKDITIVKRVLFVDSWLDESKYCYDEDVERLRYWCAELPITQEIRLDTWDIKDFSHLVLDHTFV